MFRRSRPVWLAIVPLVLTGAMGGAAASAAPSTMKDWSTKTRVEDGVLYVTAAPEVNNWIQVEVRGAKARVWEMDGALIAGAGCVQSGAWASECTGFTSIVVDGGDWGDVVEVGNATTLPCRAHGGSSQDQLYVYGCGAGGDEGDDVITILQEGLGVSGGNAPSTAANEVFGGPGRDSLDLRSSTGPLTVSLDDVANDGLVGDPRNNVHSDIEDVAGGVDSDATLIGSNGDNRLLGGNGKDVIDGAGGNDSLIGYEGDDTLRGGAGFDALDGGEGFDRCDVGADGGDALRCEAS
ncbi:calcium-binding protein [Streptomyces sp. SID3343]|uniref:calcium-binding protein n=1 Tax=Streptomyces sp. SID3343 TaxID=2690260 RepID=UPI001369673E|nr:calcium-binding protein [Streptomyces sp. SID3343]MYV98991.1 hypothetical protein [Streptomyces sp. SID3343]